jgi:hypothetical protein
VRLTIFTYRGASGDIFYNSFSCEVSVSQQLLINNSRLYLAVDENKTYLFTSVMHYNKKSMSLGFEVLNTFISTKWKTLLFFTIFLVSFSSL